MTSVTRAGRHVPEPTDEENDDEALPTPRNPHDGPTEVFLHIGTMKSGTSYLQSVLKRNRRALADAGMLTPRYLVLAISDILERAGKTLRKDFQGQWSRVVTEIDNWPGQAAVASQEFLCSVSQLEAQRIVGTLPNHKFTVIITARDLARVIPSHWQTSVKGSKIWSFAEYVPIVLDGGSSRPERRTSSAFWRHHDVQRAIDVWASAVGVENIVLITVPPSGAPSDLLWRRFAEVIGVDPDGYDYEPDAKSNVSLDYAETEMLRAVNSSVRRRLSPLEYRDLVNRYIANRLLRTAPSNEGKFDRPRLGPDNHARVAARAEQMVADIKNSGVRVVGDLDELLVPPFAGDASLGEELGPEAPIPPSVPYVIGKLVLRIARLERELAEATDGGSAAKDEGAGDGAPSKASKRAAGKRPANKRNRKRVSPAVARRAASRHGEDDDTLDSLESDGDSAGSGDEL